MKVCAVISTGCKCYLDTSVVVDLIVCTGAFTACKSNTPAVANILI